MLNYDLKRVIVYTLKSQYLMENVLIADFLKFAIFLKIYEVTFISH